MKIVVLGGGLSTERHVSLVTATSVCKALRQRGHQAIFVDMYLGLEDFEGPLEAAFDAGAEPLALLGASGCGKSVTLRCIAGILRPDEGRIALDDHVLFDSAARIDLPPQQRGVGYLFQQYALFPNMTVRGNLLAVLRGKPDREAAAADALRRFRLEAVAGLWPRQISGRCFLSQISTRGSKDSMQ